MPRGTVAKKGRAIVKGYHAADGTAAVRAAGLQTAKDGARIGATGNPLIA
jgi:hypothetical protein